MYKTFLKKLAYQTQRRLHFLTITEDLQKAVQESGINEGSVTVQTHHTTCCLWINENEKNLIGDGKEFPGDMKRILDRFAPPQEEYGHNDIRDARNPEGKRDTHLCTPDSKGLCHECINGHSHAQAMIFPHTLSMIVHQGKLLLGKWQQVLLVELDHDRQREVSVLVQGQ